MSCRPADDDHTVILIMGTGCTTLGIIGHGGLLRWMMDASSYTGSRIIPLTRQIFQRKLRCCLHGPVLPWLLEVG